MVCFSGNTNLLRDLPRALARKYVNEGTGKYFPIGVVIHTLRNSEEIKTVVGVVLSSVRREK